MGSCLTRRRCGGRFPAISATTTGRERTSRWTRMRQSPDRCRRLNSETSSPYAKSELYITATNGARPETRSQPRHPAGQVPLELVREPIQVADRRAAHSHLAGELPRIFQRRSDFCDAHPDADEICENHRLAVFQVSLL